MVLDALDITNGIILIIFCLISVYVGIRIALKYRDLKDTTFLIIGILWIILASPWYPATISFMKYLVVGTRLTEIPYFLIGVGFMPIGLILWMDAIAKFFYRKQEKLILLISIIYSIIFYILFFAFLFIDPALIGTLIGNTDVRYNSLVIIFAGSILVITLITGYIFYRESSRSENPEINLKGTLIFIAFILFVIGAGYDTIDELTFITLPILRTVEILAAIFFYMGFLLPAPIKKLFIKPES